MLAKARALASLNTAIADGVGALPPPPPPQRQEKKRKKTKKTKKERKKERTEKQTKTRWSRRNEFKVIKQLTQHV
jgi:hypothetical protein